MIFKFLKKTRVGQCLYYIIAPFLKLKKVNIRDDRAFLEEVSPDSKNSCYINRKNRVQKYDLDIVVAAYNEENYIEDCIKSILEQITEFSFRLILINDGSTDATGKIIDKYKNNRHIVVLHQKNKGFSGSRNRGLELIESKYVMFVDADDMIEEHAIQNLMSHAIKYNADIVEGNYVYLDKNRNEIKTVRHKKTSTYRALWGMPWGKVIKSNLFDNVRFPEGYWYEDSIMHQIIYPLANNIHFINEVVYKYRVNVQGITNLGKISTKCIDSLWITIQLFQDRKKYNLDISTEYYEYVLRMVKLTQDRLINQSEDIQKSAFLVFSTFINENFKDYHAKHVMERTLEKICREGNFKKLRIYSKLA